jgi:hypothetical protein
MFKQILIILFSLVIFINIKLSAHCDGVDGPVVKSAITALENKNVNLVLLWIQEQYEEEVKTLLVRELSPEAKEVADNYFFETVVRIHREGEGEPYTGLKPAGRDLSPAIKLADLSIQAGNIDELNHLLVHSLEESLGKRFTEVNTSKKFDVNDVSAGREYVETYVQFLHLAEKLYELTSQKHNHTTEVKENHKH